MTKREKFNAFVSGLTSLFDIESDAASKPEITEEKEQVETNLNAETGEPEKQVTDELPTPEPSAVETELASLKETSTQLEERVKTLEAALAESAEAKNAAETKVAQLETELSKLEDTPADPKIISVPKPAELTAAQKRLAAHKASL